MAIQSPQQLLTVGQLSRTLGFPEWKIRRAVDRLGAEVQRAGGYRLIPRELIPSIVQTISLSEGGRSGR